VTDAIKNQERINLQRLESLKNRQRSEVKTLENAHQVYKADLKKAQSEDLVELRDEHERHISSENEKKDKVLSGMKDHLSTTQKLTERQLREFKTQNANEKNILETNQQADREKTIADQELYLMEINDRFNRESKKVNEHGKANVETVKNALGQQYSDEKNRFESRINLQKNENTYRLKQDSDNHKIAMDSLVNKNKRERLGTNQRQQTELSKMTSHHAATVEKREKSYRKGLTEQDVFFEKRFAENLDANNKKLKGLEDLHKKVMDKMKMDLTGQITSRVNRSDDPFYQFSDLRPTMTTYPDRIEIRVEVPEHSKQDIQLSTNSKQAILTFNRRYNDSQKTENGTINKIDKVETLTTRLTADATLNPKKITSSYEDGVMTYVIPKA